MPAVGPSWTHMIRTASSDSSGTAVGLVWGPHEATGVIAAKLNLALSLNRPFQPALHQYRCELPEHREKTSTKPVSPCGPMMTYVAFLAQHTQEERASE